jgi:hypothetical protein
MYAKEDDDDDEEQDEEGDEYITEEVLVRRQIPGMRKNIRAWPP